MPHNYDQTPLWYLQMGTSVLLDAGILEAISDMQVVFGKRIKHFTGCMQG